MEEGIEVAMRGRQEEGRGGRNRIKTGKRMGTGMIGKGEGSGNERKRRKGASWNEGKRKREV